MKQIEFGDFQTPFDLAYECTKIINFNPTTVIEPTCGVGAFLKASKSKWSNAKLVGVEINSAYANEAKKNIGSGSKSQIFESDVFKFDWNSLLSKSGGKVLFIGNPPWVTNSTQGRLSSLNLPNKNNSQKFNGLDAITGKSNFDISESILLNLINLSIEKSLDAEFAFLIKTSVARKLFTYIMQKNYNIEFCRIFNIDAKKSFNVSVDACLFNFRFTKKETSKICEVYTSLNLNSLKSKIGIKNGKLIADLALYNQSMEHFGENEQKWRSGIKHDCTKVLELNINDDGSLTNGFGEVVRVESNYLYPYLKSSDLPKSNKARKMFIAPQRFVGQPTSDIKKNAPKTWKYLASHSPEFEKRKSIIYKKGPTFCIFGVGDYSFKPYKIAVSGLLKDLKFKLISPEKEKPVLLDDTCYFLSFDSKAEAEKVLNIVNSKKYRDALQSLVFLDAKRPFTAEILNKIAIQSFSHKRLDAIAI